VAEEAQLDWVNEFTDFLLAQKDPKAGTLFGRVMKYIMQEELRQSSKYKMLIIVKETSFLGLLSGYPLRELKI
jgi:hypothetical protein